MKSVSVFVTTTTDDIIISINERSVVAKIY